MCVLIAHCEVTPPKVNPIRPYVSNMLIFWRLLCFLEQAVDSSLSFPGDFFVGPHFLSQSSSFFVLDSTKMFNNMFNIDNYVQNNKP